MAVNLQWLRSRDAGLSALRRAARTAIVMPAMFAIGAKVLDNPALATFAAFGSFAMLLLVDFGGPIRERHPGPAGSCCWPVRSSSAVGTLASRSVWLAAVAMLVVGFVVLFAGVVSSVARRGDDVAAARLHPAGDAARTGPARSPTGSRAGCWPAPRRWSRSTLLWPAPVRDPVARLAADACRSSPLRLRTEVAFMTWAMRSDRAGWTRRSSRHGRRWPSCAPASSPRRTGRPA